MKHLTTVFCIAVALLASGRSSASGTELPPETGLPTPSPAASAASATPVAPTPTLGLAAVMERYVKAVGGRDVLRKIRTNVSVYTSTLNGHTIVTTTTTKIPVYFLQVVQVEGTRIKVTAGFDGKTAWVQNNAGVVRALSGEERAELISDAAGQNGSEVFPDRWPTTVTLQPSETVDDRPYIVLAIKAQGGVTHDIFLDPQTYRPELERHATSKVEFVAVAESFGTGPLGELQWSVITSTRSDGTPPITSVLRSVKDNVNVNNVIFAPPLGKGTETI